MSRSRSARPTRQADGSHAYTAGAPTHLRRRRRTMRLAVGAVILVLLIVGAWTVLPHPGSGPARQAGSVTCPAPPAGITVDVLNATERAGLAGVTADSLRAQRFTVGQAVNAPAGTTLDVPAEIRHGAGSATGARLLAQYVPGAVLVADRRTGSRVDLVLGPDLTGITAPSTAPTC